MKTTIIPIVFLLLIATALAEPILTPTHFNFSVYPGEMKQVNITIESESNYTINFNSSNHHVEIRPKRIDVLNGTTNISLNLTFAGDIPIGEISFIIGKNITTPKSSSTSGGVGHTTRLTNATINQSELCTIGEEMCSGDSVYTCLNQTGWQVKETCANGCADSKCIVIITDIPETNVTQNSSDIPETSPKLSPKTIRIILIVGIILIAGIIILIIIRERSFNEVEYLGKDEDINEETDNQEEDKNDDDGNDEDNNGEHRSDSDTGNDV